MRGILNFFILVRRAGEWNITFGIPISLMVLIALIAVLIVILVLFSKQRN